MVNTSAILLDEENLTILTFWEEYMPAHMSHSGAKRHIRYTPKLQHSIRQNVSSLKDFWRTIRPRMILVLGNTSKAQLTAIS
jgi:hypothetical protein